MSKEQIEDLHEIGAIDNAKFEVPGVMRPLARKKRRVVEACDGAKHRKRLPTFVRFCGTFKHF